LGADHLQKRSWYSPFCVPGLLKMPLRLALTREGDLLQVAQYSPFCVPGLLKMLLHLALTRENDLLQVAHQASGRVYEKSASVL